MQFPKVLSVEALKNYKLDIQFNDGTKGIYDVSDLAGKGVFSIWDVDNNFYKVFINKESGAISWPGDIDIDIIAAWCSIKGISPESYFNQELKYATH